MWAAIVVGLAPLVQQVERRAVAPEEAARSGVVLSIDGQPVTAD